MEKKTVCAGGRWGQGGGGGGGGEETLHAGTKPKRHSINLLEVKRDVQRRTARRSSFKGRERAIISQNNSWEFQKQSRLGTLLKA